MTRSKHFAVVVWVLGVALTGSGVAQTIRTPTSPQSSPQTSNKTKHQEPCWQQAGISKSALQQRRQIAERAWSQAEAVCNNSSLTAQQKQQQIHQIMEQAHTQMNSLVSPQQMSALKSCRAQRGETSGGSHHSGSPCGELSNGNGTPHPGSPTAGQQRSSGAEKSGEPEE